MSSHRSCPLGSAPRRSCQPRGFTLIEVLVVVAIIALLISILLPSLRAARQQARIVACASNMKTLGTATMYYTQASKDELPAGWLVDDKGAIVTDPTKIGLNPWEFLYRYAQKINLRKGGTVDPNMDYSRTVPVYSCPDDLGQHTTSELGAVTPDGIKRVEMKLSYCANLIPLYAVYLDTTKGAGKMSAIKSPQQTISYHDGGDDGTKAYADAGWITVDCISKYDYPLGNQCVMELRHTSGNNFAYYDTHVEFAKMNSNATPPRDYGLPLLTAFVPNPKSANVPSWATSSPRPVRPAPTAIPPGKDY